MKINKKNSAIILGIPLSIFMLWLAFRKVDFQQMVELLKGTNYLYLIPAILAFLLDFTLRGLRWDYILRPIKKCKKLNLISITFIGFFANSILPMRAGEVIRVIMLRTKENIASSGTLGTIILERILDIFAILFLLMITFFFFPYSDNIKRYWIIAAAFFLVAIVFSYLMLGNKEKTLFLFNKLFKWLPGNLEHKAENIIGAFITGFETLKKGKLLIITALFSIAVWLTDSLVFYFVAQGMGITQITPMGAILIMAVIALGISIPSSPGFVGVFEYFAIIACGVLGVSKSAALSFALLTHGMQLIVMVIVGMSFLAKEHISLIQLEKTAEQAADEDQ